jgi:hypothetical protein
MIKPKHIFESVVKELVAGLEAGSLVLEKDPDLVPVDGKDAQTPNKVHAEIPDNESQKRLPKTL